MWVTLEPHPDTPCGTDIAIDVLVQRHQRTMLGLLFVFMYICVNLACIGYFWRQRRDEFNVIKHGVVPVLGVLAMIPAGLAVIGSVTIPILDVELAPYTNALQYTAPIVGIWLLIGIVLFFVLRSRSPEALDRMGDVYGGEAPSPTDAVE